MSNQQQQTNTLRAAALALCIDPFVLQQFLPALQAMTARAREREQCPTHQPSERYDFTVNLPEMPARVSQPHRD